MNAKSKKAWKEMVESFSEKTEKLDVSNVEPCGKGHFCLFLQAALDAKKGLQMAFSWKDGAESVVFTRGRREPFLVLNVCPWCEEPLK